MLEMAAESMLGLGSSPQKHRLLAFSKLLFFVLVLGLSVRFFVSITPASLPLSSPLSTSETPNTGVPSETSRKGTCDLFHGSWVRNPSGPAYDNNSCPIIQAHQNCMKNGRPDVNYLHWRWKPRDCDIPAFDARRFLLAMRSKSWLFMGDSILRNHVQSLVCLLSKEEAPVEFYHDEKYQSKKWRFPSYNFTLAVLWSPFLVKADIFEDFNGVSSSEIQLHLDVLDGKWAGEYENFDYIVTAGGQWFLKTAIYWENGTIIGCHYCPGRNLTERGFEYAYRKALRLVLGFLASSFDGVVIFRTTTPAHFENGEWFSGGTCRRRVPFKEGNVTLSVVDQILRDVELEEFYAAAASGRSRTTTNLRLLDTTHLSLLRPDGHPGPYTHFHPLATNGTKGVQNDCLHWCLPGPIDSWNDIMMDVVLNV